MQILLEKGFQSVKELEGGFAAWQKAGYAITPIPTQGPSVPSLNPQLALNMDDIAIEFWLKDLHGIKMSFLELLGEKPVMLEFGSYTCPEFRQQVAATELLASKYRDGIQFVVVYVIEPHPFGSKSPYSDVEWQSLYSYDTNGNPVNQPQTYEERVRLASLCVSDAGITTLVLVDEFNNPVWQIYGPAPNLAYLIGTDGRIIEAQLWYDAGIMESAIRSYLNR